jgi:hypothetical protein
MKRSDHSPLGMCGASVCLHFTVLRRRGNRLGGQDSNCTEGQLRRIWMGFDVTPEYVMKLLRCDQISNFPVSYIGIQTTSK